MSTTDIATLFYHDQVVSRRSDHVTYVDRTRTYMPFRVHYVKVVYGTVIVSFPSF